MSSIFLSYSRKDRATAVQVAQALRGQGWPVWWDEQIPLGERFDEKTEQALKAAACVVVLWSRASVESDWVRAEASAARERRVLVPVLIEPVTPPLEFRRVQTGSLIGWSGDVEDEGFQRLLDAVAQMPRVAGDTGDAVREPWSPPPQRSRVGPMAAALIPTAVAVTGLAVMAGWRVPTNVRVTLPVQRATFTLAPRDGPLVRVLDTMTFPELTVARFESVVMEPDTIEVADPSQYILAEDRYPESGWKLVADRWTGPLRFAALDERLLPSLTMQRAPGGSNALGTLRPITLPAPSELTLEVAKERSLTLIVRSPGQTVLAVPMGGSIRLTASQTEAEGLHAAGGVEHASTWRVRLREGAAPIEINGRAGGLVTSMTLPMTVPDNVLRLFSGGSIPIGSIDFSTQDELGRRVSSVVGDGQLQVLDSPDQDPFGIEPSSVITLEGLDRFVVRDISIDGRRNLRMELEGVAGTVKTERGTLRTDHRVTALARLARERSWVIFGMLLWLATTGIGVYRLRGPRVIPWRA